MHPWFKTCQRCPCVSAFFWCFGLTVCIPLTDDILSNRRHTGDPHQANGRPSSTCGGREWHRWVIFTRHYGTKWDLPALIHFSINSRFTIGYCLFELEISSIGLFRCAVWIKLLDMIASSTIEIGNVCISLLRDALVISVTLSHLCHVKTCHDDIVKQLDRSSLWHWPACPLFCSSQTNCSATYQRRKRWILPWKNRLLPSPSRPWKARRANPTPLSQSPRRDDDGGQRTVKQNPPLRRGRAKVSKAF